MSDRVGLYLQDDFTLADSIDFVKYAEARGFESVWQSETRLVRDCIVPMAAYATVTSRIRIGAGVMNIWTRNVATMAAELVTLDDIARDRIICGLGTWYDPLAAQVGVTRRKHLFAMREVLTTLKRLMQFERVTYRGEFVHLDDVHLDIVTGRRQARRIPFYIGATGAKTLALAGEIADGVLLNYLVSPHYNEMAIAQIEIGAKQADRLLHHIDRPQLIVCSVSVNRDDALNTARRLVAQYIVQQPQLMRANGMPQGLIDELAQVLPPTASLERIEQAMTLVPDDVVQMVTASGTPDEVKAKVRQYVASGTTMPVLYPLGRDVRLLIDTFANGYSK
jgi:5,10-methylenetetrahydromethanopterin reductase